MSRHDAFIATPVDKRYNGKLRTSTLRTHDIVYDEQGESYELLARPEKWRADGRFGFRREPVLEARYWEPRGWAALAKPARGHTRVIPLRGTTRALRKSLEYSDIPRGTKGTAMWT